VNGLTSKSNHHGFTLLEVLIALLIISVGLVALIQVGATRASTVLTVEQKSMAYHIADSAMNELYGNRTLKLGRHDGSRKSQGQTWYWQADAESTDNPDIIRIDLKVSDKRTFDYAQAQLTGFKRR